MVMRGWRRSGWLTALLGTGAVAIVATISLVLTGTFGTPVATPGHGRDGGAPRTVQLVGLGDSIVAAAACPGCTAFVDLYGRQITAATGRPVSVDNRGVNGWTSADLLASLSGGGPASAAVADAKVITVTIGANDFAPMLDAYLAGTCGGADNVACFGPELAGLRSNLTAILRRIHALRAERPTAVRVTGYWDVFTDGDVATQAYGAGFQTDSTALTLQVNAVIRSVTQALGATYVDLFDPFKGPVGDGDPTSLLAADGDHPNQAGHQEIADTLALAGYAPLHTRR